MARDAAAIDTRLCFLLLAERLRFMSSNARSNGRNCATGEGMGINSQPRNGPVGSGAGEIVAGRATAAGLGGDFAGHSLRAGFATAAEGAGLSEATIMRQWRWKSAQIARRYIATSARAHAGTTNLLLRRRHETEFSAR
jgi:hypothetical protein